MTDETQIDHRKATLREVHETLDRYASETSFTMAVAETDSAISAARQRAGAYRDAAAAIRSLMERPSEPKGETSDETADEEAHSQVRQDGQVATSVAVESGAAEVSERGDPSRRIFPVQPMGTLGPGWQGDAVRRKKLCCENLVPSGTTAQHGEKWTCPECKGIWVHACNEAFGCSWIPAAKQHSEQCREIPWADCSHDCPLDAGRSKEYPTPEPRNG